MARKFGKGQQFDKYYKILNNYIDKQTYPERVENLNYLRLQLLNIHKLQPKSEYEIKDKSNLIEQYNMYIVNPY